MLVAQRISNSRESDTKLFSNSWSTEINTSAAAVTSEEAQAANGASKDIYEYELGTLTAGSNGKAALKGTMFIPLNLQVTVDGLSGIKQYQLFKTNQELLPSDYHDRLAFIVKGLTHKIDDKGWTTNIETLAVKRFNKDTTEDSNLGTVLNIKVPDPVVAPKEDSSSSTGPALLESGFRELVAALEDKIGVERDALLRIMKHESGLNPAAVNRSTNATGLIQFMPATAIGLGTTVEALKMMTGVQQLTYVEKYFKPIFGKAKVIGDLYLYTFIPAAMGKDDSFVLGVKDSSNKVFDLSQGALYDQNSGFDADKKGYYTIGDVKKRINNTYL